MKDGFTGPDLCIYANAKEGNAYLIVRGLVGRLFNSASSNKKVKVASLESDSRDSITHVSQGDSGITRSSFNT